MLVDAYSTLATPGGWKRKLLLNISTLVRIWNKRLFNRKLSGASSWMSTTRKVYTIITLNSSSPTVMWPNPPVWSTALYKHVKWDLHEEEHRPHDDEVDGLQHTQKLWKPISDKTHRVKPAAKQIRLFQREKIKHTLTKNVRFSKISLLNLNLSSYFYLKVHTEIFNLWFLKLKIFK